MSVDFFSLPAPVDPRADRRLRRRPRRPRLHAAELRLAAAMRLPTFEADGLTFAPDRNAAAVLA
jgi:hypothetical protein